MSSRNKRRRISESGEGVVTTGENAVGNIASDDLETRPHKNPAPQSRSLFVRSLPLNATTESLTEFFSQSFPLKHATVVVDSATKQSKGYGFITFADAEDAERARKELDGSLFEGKKIKLEVAEPRHREVGTGASEDRKKSHVSTKAAQARAERQKRRTEDQKPLKLIIRNLPWSIKEPGQLALLFRSYGKVRHATLPKSKPGTSPGFGFVVLRGRRNAEKALVSMNGKEIDGRTLAVDWAIEKEIWDTLQDGEHTGKEPKLNRDPQNQPEDDASTVKSEDDEESVELEDILPSDADHGDISNDEEEDVSDDDVKVESVRNKIHDNSSTIFIRNLPFLCTDEILLAHFESFGPVRYARVVLDHVTERSKGTGFVCFFNVDDATNCLRGAPRPEPLSTQRDKTNKSNVPKKHSILEDAQADSSGRYTLDGRVLQISRAVDRSEANQLATQGSSVREARDKDKRRLYLLSEGTISSDSPIYGMLSASETRMREDSAKQRQALIKSNPSLHLSLTRLSIRNIPRNVDSKSLKALAREAVVEFAKDAREGRRRPLSKEELSRGGDEMKVAEKERKAKGKGIVRQAKVVYEGKEGGKVSEKSGAGRSRGYGFIEYCSHRLALMGLRFLNGHSVRPDAESGIHPRERPKRLIVEFAIENAQVVARRHEHEIKARERSRMVESNRSAREVEGSRSKKPLSRNEAMAKTRKGATRKPRPKSLGQSAGSEQDHSLDSAAPEDISIKKTKLESIARRQQIIGRKRVLRKSRRSSST